MYVYVYVCVYVCMCEMKKKNCKLQEKVEKEKEREEMCFLHMKFSAKKKIPSKFKKIVPVLSLRPARVYISMGHFIFIRKPEEKKKKQPNLQKKNRNGGGFCVSVEFFFIGFNRNPEAPPQSQAGRY